MRGLAWLLVSLLLLPAGCAVTGPEAEPKTQPQRVLFIGNSLSYVGNLPAVHAALANANGHPTQSDMIVRGGATLSQRVADGSAAAALASGRYQVLVLQERGGDLMCSFGPDSCVESRAAIDALVTLASEQGTRALLLGSYQPHPLASRKLVEHEAAAAAEVGIDYVEISETLHHAMAESPELAWFADDGAHPGPALTLLAALRLYQTLHGELPPPATLRVEAPIYAVSSGLIETLRPAGAPPPRADTPMRIEYPFVVVERIHAAIAATRSGLAETERTPPSAPPPAPRKH